MFLRISAACYDNTRGPFTGSVAIKYNSSDLICNFEHLTLSAF